MTASEILAASALEQARLVRTKRISSEELTRLYLDRIERLNPRLNAFVSVFRRRAILTAKHKDLVLRRARSVDELPPFHGVPTGIKDMNFVRLSVTRFGSRGLRLLTPIDDRTVAAVRRGGFVILGKLATSELGVMPVTEPDIHPPTRNPWHLGHTAGGSSGGSGSAVGGALLPIAPGSDGAGSVRIPSSFCHLYGLKPSRGRVPNHLNLPNDDLIYTDGPLARTVDDAAALLDVLARAPAGRTHVIPLPIEPFSSLAARPPRQLKVRLVAHNPLASTHPEVSAALDRVARAVESMGHVVEPGDPPEGTLEEFLPLYQSIFSRIPLVRWSRTQPITRWLARGGRAYSTAELRETFVRLKRRMDDWLDATGADVLLSPTVPHLPPAIGAFSALPPAEGFAAAAQLGTFTALYNLGGGCAASIPAGLSSSGLPIGVQVGARVGDDALVLALSRQIEEALPWRDRRSPIAAEN